VYSRDMPTRGPRCVRGELMRWVDSGEDQAVLDRQTITKAAAPSDPPVVAVQVFCHNCGCQLAGTEAFCPACGQGLLCDQAS
jgi:membrane protease subunit (stomatin/prohibitin family)